MSLNKDQFIPPMILLWREISRWNLKPRFAPLRRAAINRLRKADSLPFLSDVEKQATFYPNLPSTAQRSCAKLRNGSRRNVSTGRLRNNGNKEGSLKASHNYFVLETKAARNDPPLPLPLAQHYIPRRAVYTLYLKWRAIVVPAISGSCLAVKENLPW